MSLTCSVLVFFVCIGHSSLLYAAFFLMHVNDLPALNRSTIISVLSQPSQTCLMVQITFAPEVHGKQGLLLSLWAPKKEKLLMLTLLASNVLELLACIWLLFLGLLFFFCMHDNICVLLKPTGNLLFIAMHPSVTLCLCLGSPIRHGKTDFATQEEY